VVCTFCSFQFCTVIRFVALKIHQYNLMHSLITNCLYLWLHCFFFTVGYIVGLTITALFVAGNATYNSPCRSVGPSVGPSVRQSVGPSVPLYFFSVFELFEGRIARVLVSCGCLCPCPTHYCPCPTHYCPCPTARDRASRVYGLVIGFVTSVFVSVPQIHY